MDPKAYFEAFCPEIPGKTLHHIPGRPTAREDSAYLETLALYQSEFAEAEPQTIWPTTATMRQVVRARAGMRYLICAAMGFALLHFQLIAILLGIGAAVLGLWSMSRASWALVRRAAVVRVAAVVAPPIQMADVVAMAADLGAATE